MREGREEEGETKKTNTVEALMDILATTYCDAFLRTCTLCYVVLLFPFTIPLPCQNLRVEIIKGRGNNACGRGNKQRRADKKLSCNVSFLHFQRAVLKHALVSIITRYIIIATDNLLRRAL
jgi:hypothetical protein